MFLLQICSVFFLFQVKCYASLCQSIHALLSHVLPLQALCVGSYSGLSHTIRVFFLSPMSAGLMLIFWALSLIFDQFQTCSLLVVSFLSRSNWPWATTGLFTVVSQNVSDDSWFLAKFSKYLLKEWRDQVAFSGWWCPPSHHCPLLGWRTRDFVARAAPELCSKSTNFHL